MRILALALLLIAHTSVHAINKCVDAQGKTTYTDDPCPKGDRSKPSGTSSSLKLDGSSSSSGALVSTYQRQIAALRSGSWNSYLDTLAARRRAQVEPGGEKSLRMFNAMLPHSTRVVEETISPGGDKGTLKVKGIGPSLGTGKEAPTYGTIEFVKEAGAWKIDQQAWSAKEWTTATAIGQSIQGQQAAPCAGVPGKPESPPDQEMVRLLAGETLIAKFELAPGATRQIRHAASGRQKITFRVAHNDALKCKYGSDYPAGMKADGKHWIHGFYAGQTVEPVNGQIALAFKNDAQEPMNFIVVSGKE